MNELTVGWSSRQVLDKSFEVVKLLRSNLVESPTYFEIEWFIMDYSGEVKKDWNIQYLCCKYLSLNFIDWFEISIS